MEAKVKSILPFQADQKIVCPWHGLGTIISIEERFEDQKFYKISYTKEKLVSFVPLARMRESGVRRLCSKEIANKVFGVLEKPFRIGRGMWSKRAQEYDTKVYSGSILLTAEVVRDLFITSKDPNRSYSERIIYENALSRVTSELAAVLGELESNVEERMIDILSKSASSSGKIVTPEVTDDFKDDLESFSEDEEGEDTEMVA